MVRSLAPLRHRGFRLLVTGQLASNVGDAFYAVALPWYVLADHGGALLLGTVLAAYGVPRTVLLAFGGQASDRWRPWTVMMTSDGVRTIAVAALAVAAASGPARAVILVPIAAVLGAGEGLFLPGSFAIVPALLPDEELQSGNALTSAATQLAMLAGPAVGGLLVAVIGPSPAFAIDAATFAISALTLAGVRSAERAAAVAGAKPAAIITGTEAAPPPSAADSADSLASDTGAGATGTGVPGTGVPGTGVPGTGVPGTGVPGTGVPGTGVPGTGVPGTGVPGTGVPGTGVPGTGVPGTGVPGTGVPGTGVPGTGVPGTGVPGTSVPGTGAQDGAAHDRAAGSPTVWKLLRSERILQISLLVTVAANLGSAGADEVALPSLVHGPLRGSAGGYGSLIAAFGAGALLGTLVAGQARRAQRPAMVGSLVFLAQALFLAVVPYAGGLITVGAVMAAVGVFNGFGNVVMITVFQRWAPPDMLGRLTGLLLLASFGVFPISVVLGALVVHNFGPALFFPLAAALLAAAILAGLSQRTWRDFGAVSDAGTASSRRRKPGGRLSGRASATTDYAEYTS